MLAAPVVSPDRRRRSPSPKRNNPKTPAKSRKQLLESATSAETESHSNDLSVLGHHSTHPAHSNDLSVASTSACVTDPAESATQYTLKSSFKQTTASLSPDSTQIPTSQPSSEEKEGSTFVITGMENLSSTNQQQQKTTPAKAKKTVSKVSKKKMRLNTKKKKQLSKVSKSIHNSIEVGMTVSGRFGDLIPLPENSPAGKRRVREKRITKVVRCLGRSKWQIEFLDGNTVEKFSNSLTIER